MALWAVVLGRLLAFAFTAIAERAVAHGTHR